MKKAVVINPHSPEPLNALGFSYSSVDGRENAKRAETYFKKAIEADSSYYVTYFNYGILKYNQEKYTQAIHQFEEALKMKDNFMSAHYGMFRAIYQIDK